ncbi:MAG: hypothetical protein KTR32_26890 [Granulosicoccus sp.]|nr:hypothetical protein [Granulosicoccus sp.]
MHADELRLGVTKVVSLLHKAQIKVAVDQFRSAKGDQKIAAAARLGHAGAMVMEKFDELSANERLVVKCLHLESLGSSDYWNSLLDAQADPAQRQAEIVRLASRVMFASNHLPAMMSLLRITNDSPSDSSEMSGAFAPLEAGEGAMYIRLTDAGEKASDPDRIARAIDGIDMLYSACASIARKPAMDLRLDAVYSKPNRDRDFRFTGERDSISAVIAVVDSIPAALSEIDSEQDLDLNTVISTLPIFHDLNTLATLGTFSNKDLNDISETMHQGALLTLESGVILIDENLAAESEAVGSNTASSQLSRTNAKASFSGNASRESERDEHYDRYLKEREAMQQSQSKQGAGVGTKLSNDDSPDARQEAVDDLLKTLGRSRSN